MKKSLLCAILAELDPTNDGQNYPPSYRVPAKALMDKVKAGDVAAISLLADLLEQFDQIVKDEGKTYQELQANGVVAK